MTFSSSPMMMRSRESKVGKRSRSRHVNLLTGSSNSPFTISASPKNSAKTLQIANTLKSVIFKTKHRCPNAHADAQKKHPPISSSLKASALEHSLTWTYLLFLQLKIPLSRLSRKRNLWRRRLMACMSYLWKPLCLRIP